MEKENKEVYILDAEAAVYNIPLDKYTKNYDMFLKGNIGKDGEEGIIKQIQKDSENKSLSNKTRKIFTKLANTNKSCGICKK